MKNYLSALLLGTALLTPLVINADEHHERRYYDKDHKDYHEWNERKSCLSQVSGGAAYGVPGLGSEARG